MYDEQPVPEPHTKGSHSTPLLGVATVAAAGLVYCLTGHPLLAALLPWLHGGWNTFHTGFWILRKDPLRSRARICFVFYLAAACWKAAAAALAMVLIFAFADGMFGVKLNQKEIVATVMAFLAGLVLNSLIGVIAVTAAIIYGVRAWVQSNLRTVVRGDLSRASQIGPSPRQTLNFGVVVVITAMLLPVIVALTVAMSMATMDKKANPHVDDSQVMLWLFVLFAGPLIVYVFCKWLTARVIAKSPQECWPPGTCPPSPDRF